MTVNSPSARSSRRDSWEASLQQRGDNNASGYAAAQTQDVKRSRSVTPPRSGGESDDEDEEFYFNDNDSTCSGSEEPSQPGKGTWTRDEHKRFLEAIKIYVNGPWKLVAEYVGTRTVRQTMTHAQKYRQKAARRIRGLRTKQAIMRMHHGHEVSEESMVQEQIRTMLGQSRHAYLPPELVAQLNYSPSASPVGSPVMPGSPVLHGSMPSSPAFHRSPAGSPFMPSSPVGSPYMPSSPLMYANDGMLPSLPSLTIDNSMMSSRLETPLSITIRSTPMNNDSMPVYAPASPHSSYSGSPAASPVSALTAQLAQQALAPRMDTYDLDIIEDNNQVPSLEECANVLMDVLFDEQALQKEAPAQQQEQLQQEPGAPFNMDI